ncbi:MAG: pyridoxamine 5'-phosphate oxidase [Bacteroidia bacterium]
MRVDYQLDNLVEDQVAADPIRQFETWFGDAVAAGLREANAMTLATTHEGQPTARVVLLKGFDEAGFVFFTNYTSRKGREIAANDRVCLNFFWAELERQVRIEGHAQHVSAAASDAYYQSRDRGSRLGAWASAQSQPLHSREDLVERLREIEARYAGQEDIPRPPHWGGYLVVPDYVEFWQGRPSRLHDRLAYTRTEDGNWQLSRLSP